MAAQILKIDLSRKSFEIETIPDRIIRQYLGGRGLGAYLLYQLVPGKADPLGEDNYVIFSAGPANGTNFYYSSKTVVTTKSPLTGIYLYSISSGSVAHQIRRAGFWAIAIKGIADSPTYIVVNNQDVEFRDAASLSGMDPAEAQRAMLAELSGKKAATLAYKKPTSNISHGFCTALKGFVNDSKTIRESSLYSLYNFCMNVIKSFKYV